MKPIFLTAVAVSALFAIPALAQQGETGEVPGENFLTNWDTDGDGTVTAEELQERRKEIFSAFDADEDGALSEEEFGMLEEARSGSMKRPQGRGKGGGGAEQVLSFSATDADGDGSVTLEEFLGASETWMEVMDSDRDGVLTAGDFGPGARQGGQGQGRGQDQGQRMGQGNGEGGGQRMGKNQERGQGQEMAGNDQRQRRSCGQGQGGQGKMQDRQQGMEQQQGKGKGGGQDQACGYQEMKQGQHQGKGQRGHGRQAGQGTGRMQQGGRFEAVPTGDGALWILDSRTGDVFVCKAVADSEAEAGFAPVCLDARP